MKKIIFGVLGSFALLCILAAWFVHSHIDQTKSLFLIQKCPDKWYQNDMPTIDRSAQTQQYFIIDGKRADINDYDITWIKLHCSVRLEHVY